MKKILAVMAVIIILCTAGAAFAADPIKVGYLAALTGDYAAYGITEVNMAKMVVGDVNAKGGILGRKIELVVYDTKTRNEDAVNAVRRMIESDKVVAIIGANSSGINIATAPIFDKGKTPQISTVGTNPLVTVDHK
ncbi:MAG: ABC transporter substrate-binding protein, partial [Synergistaceae bacterium]|nr:ABC transporter substrate-binding protein [Synergistaceae bacterium]